MKQSVGEYLIFSLTKQIPLAVGALPFSSSSSTCSCGEGKFEFYQVLSKSSKIFILKHYLSFLYPQYAHVAKVGLSAKKYSSNKH